MPKTLQQCKSGKELIAYAKSHGAEIRPGKGSHQIVMHSGKSVPVPVHGNQQLAKGLRLAIIKAFLSMGLGMLVLIYVLQFVR